MVESVYTNVSKDQFLKDFDFKTNPEFCLHWMANNNAPAILDRMKEANLVHPSQAADPELVYNILYSLYRAGRVQQLRELCRVPANMSEPCTITPAISEALDQLRQQTMNHV